MRWPIESCTCIHLDNQSQLLVPLSVHRYQCPPTHTSIHTHTHTHTHTHHTCSHIHTHTHTHTHPTRATHIHTHIHKHTSAHTHTHTHTQHHSAEVLKWEESKRWQKRVEGLKSKLSEKNRELEAAQKQINSFKEMLSRSVLTHNYYVFKLGPLTKL